VWKIEKILFSVQQIANYIDLQNTVEKIPICILIHR